MARAVPTGRVANGGWLVLVLGCASAGSTSRLATAPASPDQPAGPSAPAEMPAPAWARDARTVCFEGAVTDEGPHTDETSKDLIIDAVKRILPAAGVAIEQPPCHPGPRSVGLAVNVALSRFAADYTKVPKRARVMAFPETSCSFPAVAVELTVSAPAQTPFRRRIETSRTPPRYADRCESEPIASQAWQRPVLAALASVWGDDVVAAAMLDSVAALGGSLASAAIELHEERPIPTPTAVRYLHAGLASDDERVVMAAAAWVADMKNEAPNDLCAALLAAERRLSSRPVPGAALLNAASGSRCFEHGDLRRGFVEGAGAVIDEGAKPRRLCAGSTCGQWKAAALLLGEARAQEALRSLVRLLSIVYPDEPSTALVEAIGKIGLTPEVADAMARVLNREPWTEKQVATVRKWGAMSAVILCGAVDASDSGAARQAREAIVEAGDQGLPCVKKNLGHRKPDVRGWAAAAAVSNRK